MGAGSQYIVAAYAVILFGLVMYVVVLGLKSARMARESEVLARVLDRRLSHDEDEAAAVSGHTAAENAGPPPAEPPPAVIASSSPGRESPDDGDRAAE